MPQKNKFISTYVNEMYAIIVGLGIANIIFHENFNPSGIIDIVMVFFVTFVTLLYWWDWSEYIETEVATTKLELFIDFMILFDLEMLFVFYNSPVEQAVAFITLGILDLCWVVNHIREVSIEKGKSSTIGKGRWILEKFIVIGLYLGSFTIVLFIDLDPFTRWIQSLVIIVFFLIVRNIGFLQVRKARKYFTKAALDDTQAIIDINHSYIETKDAGGFLLKRLEYNEVEDVIEADLDQFYVAKGEEDIVLGYVEIKDKIEEDLMKDISWENEALKNKFLSQDYLLIEQVATRKGDRRGGVARFLYKSLMKEFPDKNFAGFVANKPVSNQASVKFHREMKFRQIATFKRPEFAGLHNYQSILFVLFREID